MQIEVQKYKSTSEVVWKSMQLQVNVFPAFVLTIWWKKTRKMVSILEFFLSGYRKQINGEICCRMCKENIFLSENGRSRDNPRKKNLYEKVMMNVVQPTEVWTYLLKQAVRYVNTHKKAFSFFGLKTPIV